MPGSEKIPFYSPNEWLSERDNSGAACLSHLIRNHSPAQPAVLEVGPADEIDIEFETKAPIAYFQEQHPDIPCAAIGPEDMTREQEKCILGNVPWIQGMYGEGIQEYRDRVHDMLHGIFGEHPSIIYASHVIENSRGGPLSCYRIFEEAAKELPNDGLLVIDNAFGTYNHVARREWEHSKRMMLHSIYNHLITPVADYWNHRQVTTYLQSIFVFQRAPEEMSTDEINLQTRSAIKGLITESKTEE